MKIDKLRITWIETAMLKPYPNNARVHSQKQVRQIAGSIERFGFTNPILVDEADMLLAGHGRLEAAKYLGLDQVPTIRLSHLTPDEQRAYILADNKLAQNADWDIELLALELGELAELNFDLDLTGFSSCEIDLVLDEVAQASPDTTGKDEDFVPEPTSRIVTQRGDLWKLGRHRLLCGDALSQHSVGLLMGGLKADMIFTDPPYNVPIEGHVCGVGKVHHREFVMATGEMSREQFSAFLISSLTNAAVHARDGAIAYVCMDWRHMAEVLAAGEAAFDEFKNLCVWNKNNAGMGTFYRSKHELVFVFKKGRAPHTNNFGLGENGRYRTNVWDYTGISSFGASRDEDLAMHPTVKPVALIADALKDCSRPGDLVLDLFGGSGSTLIAAQKTGRAAYLVEIDPVYCDTIIRRFTRLTGRQAIHVESNKAFDELELGLDDEDAN